jgi:hypothetical protein
VKGRAGAERKRLGRGDTLCGGNREVLVQVVVLPSMLGVRGRRLRTMGAQVDKQRRRVGHKEPGIARFMQEWRKAEKGSRCA